MSGLHVTTKDGRTRVSVDGFDIDLETTVSNGLVELIFHAPHGLRLTVGLSAEDARGIAKAMENAATEAERS